MLTLLYLLTFLHVFIGLKEQLSCKNPPYLTSCLSLLSTNSSSVTSPSSLQNLSGKAKRAKPPLHRRRYIFHPSPASPTHCSCLTSCPHLAFYCCVFQLLGEPLLSYSHLVYRCHLTLTFVFYYWCPHTVISRP